MFKVAGVEELDAESQVHQDLAAVQAKTAFMPDYAFKSDEAGSPADSAEDQAAWPAVSAGTSVAGLVGGALTLVLTVLIGLAAVLIRRRQRGRSAL